jgi:NADH:ubiquinone oxidoreductase subunit D
MDLCVKDAEVANFIKTDLYTKTEKSPTKERKRDRNRIPRKFDSKQKQMRMSSANHYKPLESIRSPIPIQIISDDENDTKSVEKLPFTEEGKFMIPNEGNINKSPMSLFTKATRVS